MNSPTDAIEDIFRESSKAKMEHAARYIVRKNKKGRYIVSEAPSHWLHRDVPGFATEADANAWIAGRHQSLRRDSRKFDIRCE